MSKRHRGQFRGACTSQIWDDLNIKNNECNHNTLKILESIVIGGRERLEDFSIFCNHRIID